MFRRIRPQFKPNVSPRGPPKPAPAAPQRPSVSATPPAPVDDKGDKPLHSSATQGKSSGPSSGDASVSAPVSHATDSSVGDKPATGSRSPRKSVSLDHPKSPGVSAHSQSDHRVSGSSSTTSPSKARSPRKSVSSERPHVSGELPSGALPAGSGVDTVVDTSSQRGSSSQDANTVSAKKASAAPVKTTPLQYGARARFKPNLAAGKKFQRPGAADKKVPEVDLSGQTPSEKPDGDSEAHSGTAISISEQQEAVATPVSNDSELNQASEERAERPDQSGRASGEQSAATGGEGEGDQVDAQLADTHSDLAASDNSSIGTAGTDDLADFPSDALGRTGYEKKTRRVKPALPSTEIPADRGKMKMSDLIYWNPPRNHMKRLQNSKARLLDNSRKVEDARDGGSKTSDVADGDTDECPVPQLRLTETGSIIVNQDSLVVENKMADSSFAPTEIVEEVEDRYVTYTSFRKVRRQKRWTDEETSRFYRALSTVGTDFSLMCNMFPGRSRRDLKNKFSKEEKQNRNRVDQALRERQPFDRTTFEKAREEDAAEKQKLKDLQEQKKKKKTQKLKGQSEEEAVGEEMEAVEERMEKEMDGEEQEGRKENSRKRKNGKLCQDGNKFSGYKKRKREQARTGHAQEVADILVNMSRGKMTVGTDRQDAEYDDNMSDISSVISDHDSVVSCAAFVPKVARAVKPSKETSSKNVVIDPEVSVTQWTIPEGGEMMANAKPSQTSATNADPPGLAVQGAVVQNGDENTTTQTHTTGVTNNPLIPGTSLSEVTNPLIPGLSHPEITNPLIPGLPQPEVINPPKPGTSHSEVTNPLIPGVSRPEVTTNPLIPGVSHPEVTTNPLIPGVSTLEATNNLLVPAVSNSGATSSQLTPGELSSGVASSTGSDPHTAQTSSFVMESDAASISAIIDQLQAQSSTPCDVLFVEHTDGESQGYVHVYLVPRITNDTEGGADSTAPREGGPVNSEGDTVSSLQSGSAMHNSLPIAGSGGDCSQVHKGTTDSAIVEGSAGNGVESVTGETCIHVATDVGKSSMVEQGVSNCEGQRTQEEGTGMNNTVCGDGAGQSVASPVQGHQTVLTEDSGADNMVNKGQAGNSCVLAEGGTGNSVEEGGGSNSQQYQLEGGNHSHQVDSEGDR